jgi:hypothetical protein
LEDPRGFVDDDAAERFWVVGFEAFDHEFDGRVVHVGHAKVLHVEDDGCSVDCGSEEESGGFDCVDGEALHCCIFLLSSSLQIARSEALAMLSVTLFCEMFTRQFGCALIKRGDFSMRVVEHAQSRFGRARPINTF